ncbi:MAG TPA: hypothetical protein VMT52_17785 [Planctomycetota bacterium]|nr:hypothetical protein [Planctomycetota bacterium]
MRTDTHPLRTRSNIHPGIEMYQKQDIQAAIALLAEEPHEESCAP